MIKAIYNNSAYYIPISNLRGNKKEYLAIKFDTGAVNTVLSFSALVGNLKFLGISEDKFEEQIKKKVGIITKDFKAANGKTMLGYLCCSQDVIIDGYKFDKFYYYLIFNIERKLALLGDDFISCCNFEHKVNSNIEITHFDTNHYKINEDKEKNCISEVIFDELLELSKTDIDEPIKSAYGDKILSDAEVIEEVFRYPAADE